MIQENTKLLLYSTVGTSMFPFIRWNEYILVEKVGIKNIQIDDVVVFESDKGRRVCHRVVEIKEKDGILWFQTKGDRSKFCDAPINQEAILGKVIAVKRKLKLIELYTKGWKSLLYKLNCFFACGVFFIKKFLAKIR